MLLKYVMIDWEVPPKCLTSFLNGRWTWIFKKLSEQSRNQIISYVDATNIEI